VALLALVLLLPPLLVSKEDDAHSTNANNSPATLVHAVFQVMKASNSLDWPLPGGQAGGKDGKGDCCNDDGMKLDCAPDQDFPPLPPQSGGGMATRIVGE
jgi:hypothetical protein